MQPYIGRWHCQYRVSGEQPGAAVAAGRLERAVRLHAVDACADALERAFADDETVYVVRQVRHRLTFAAAMRQDELTLARAWGHRAGAAVVRTIAAHGDDPSVVMRFSDRADYVAHFLADLVHDRAWDRWYYGFFSNYRLAARQEIAGAILREYRDDLAAILRYLSALGALDAVLTLVDSESAAALRSGHSDARPVDDTGADFLVFVRAALTLVDALGVRAAAMPAEAALLSEYTAARPLRPDWSSRRSLAVAVLNVLELAAARGYVERARADLIAWNTSRGEVLAALDWADTDWLSAAIGEWLAREESDEPAASAPADALPLAPRAASLTPSHRMILERLRHLFESGAIALPSLNSDATLAQESMRVFAALAGVSPELASNPSAIAIVRAIVAACRAVRRSHEPRVIIDAIRDGLVERTIANQHLEPELRDGLRAAAAMRTAAAEVLSAATRPEMRALEGATRAAPPLTIASDCAGLFLLVRAVLDVRLSALVASTPAAPPLESLLLSIGLQWSGSAAFRGGALDSGLVLWAGLWGDGDGDPLSRLSLSLETCPLLATRVRALMLDRQACDPRLEVVETIPDAWYADLTANWPPGVPIDRDVTLVAVHLLHLWAQWLPALASSSVPYLLSNFVRRPGVIQVTERSVDVALRPAALDVVIEMAGYLNEVAAVPWLRDRKLSLRIDRSLR